MRRYAFILTIISLLALIFLHNLPAKQITEISEIDKYLPNQKLKIAGRVIEETISNDKRIYLLDNSLQLQCDLSCPSIVNQNIESIVILERYNNKNYLKILSVKII